MERFRRRAEIFNGLSGRSSRRVADLSARRNPSEDELKKEYDVRNPPEHELNFSTRVLGELLARTTAGGERATATWSLRGNYLCHSRCAIHDRQEAELADDAKVRDERDEAAPGLRRAVLGARDAIHAGWGTLGLRAFGITGESPTDPYELESLARGLVAALADNDLVLPAPRPGVTVDRPELASHIAAGAAAVTEALRSVRREETEAQTTQSAETALGYRRRTIPWPEDIGIETGWRKLPALCPFGLPAEEPEPPMEHVADPGVERVLDAVLAVADAPRSGLETVRHGPGGNPVRRLALLAFVQLTQREIGQRMGMSPTQVAQILHRFRHRGPAMVDADLRAVEQEVSSGSA